MSIFKLRQVMLLLALFCSGAGTTWAQVPPGWLVAGSAPQDYDFSLDSSTPPNGRSALIAAKSGAALRGFGTLMQEINAENYRGQHVRLSGYLKTQDATRAQMWMRVDGPDRQVLSFDNMDNRPVTGTTGWRKYEVILDVPADSVNIAFGFLLTQSGKLWGHDFKLEQVDASVPATASTAPQLPDEPVNMDFRGAASAPSTGPSSYNPAQVDVYDIYRQEGYHIYTNFPQRVHTRGTSDGQFSADKYNLCGMGVVAEAKNSAGTILRWDVKFSVAINGGSKFASVAVGAFTLRKSSDKPTPRQPITHLAVQLQADQEPPTEARISSTPNVDNGVTGEFPEGYAERLFNAFDAGTPFTLSLTYDSGVQESVLVRTHGGSKDHTNHGTGASVERCLRALLPTTKEGLQNPIYQLWHPQ